MSLRGIGKRAGLQPFHIMAIELGQVATNTRTLRAIAGALGVAPVDLLNYDTENDDIGHLLELMRKQPDYVRAVMSKVKPLVKRKNAKLAPAC